MNGPAPAFSRGSALALVAVGFALFLALVYLLAEGENLDPAANRGGAHAASRGLDGFAGLTRMLDHEGYDVRRSRSVSDYETGDLLVLTPPPGQDPEALGEILQQREYLGPTLVILPKWRAFRPPPLLPEEVAERFKPGWVILEGAGTTGWADALPYPFAFEHRIEQLEPDESPGWEGLGLAGELPTRTILYTGEAERHAPLAVDAAGHWLAFEVVGSPGSAFAEDAHAVFIVAEPDLLNNYGLADAKRAALALALVSEATYGGEITGVVFDLTLAGFGGSMNLLTLAFRPPFLAATLCLLLALLVIGWRAFRRFGPAAASGGPAIAFGKERLIANSAGLILRARRAHLLAGPYAALAARRIARTLGLARPERAAIDAALARRWPEEEPFSARAARLEAAGRPAEILRAAEALDALTRKVQQ